MSDVHSSEASEACLYVTLCLVNYFCLTVSDIEVTTKHNFIRTVLILDQTESTNRSIMQLKATFAKQLLVNSLDLSLSRQHYAVCVGTLKFQPTMVLQSCFYCSQRKMVLSGVAGPGFLLFLPIWMGSYAHPSAKDTLICGSFNFKFLFPRKPQFCFYGRSKKLILRVTDMIWIFPAFYLIGDIPPSPGDIPGI